MKKSILVALSITLFSLVSMAQEINPVLITIDGKEIRKNEFLSIYTQNNNEPKFDKASMDDYLDIFVKYKLKVFEAEEMGFDTIKSLKNELNGYVNKSAEKYLSDSEATESLIKEAYERKKYEIKASHILITKGGDTYKKALEIRAEIIKSGDFEAAAAKYSQDPSVKDNKGSLGYFTVFQMLYLFEEAAYTTKVGDISMPVKTKFGYHIIQLIERRGEMVNVRHILMTPKVSSASLLEAKNQLKKVEELMNTDALTFEDAAKNHSDDISKNNGGLLINPQSGSSLFTIDQLPLDIRYAAERLKEGEVSSISQYVMQDGKKAYRIIKITKKTKEHTANLVDDFTQINDAALNSKKQLEINNWVNSKIKITYIRLESELGECDVLKKWKK